MIVKILQSIRKTLKLIGKYIQKVRAAKLKIQQSKKIIQTSAKKDSETKTEAITALPSKHAVTKKCVLQPWTIIPLICHCFTSSAISMPNLGNVFLN